MFSITRSEKNASLFILAVVIAANSIKLGMKYFMPASHLIQIIENEKAYPKIDLNSAGRQELESVPYIGKTLAGRILYYRKKKGPFHSKEELRNVKGISGKVYNKIEKYLRVRK